VRKLSISFYRQADVVQIAKKLLGKYFFSRIGGELTGGIIAETEAYAGITDKASHAYNGRRTTRTEIMYLPGGVSYVYFTYGMHHLFNVVTNKKDVPDAVLIRGILPVEGIDIMVRRRGINNRKQLCNGPAKLCQAMGITLEHNALNLTGDLLWIADNGFSVPEEKIVTTPRIGVDYAGDDALLPYRMIYRHPDYLPVKNRK